MPKVTETTIGTSETVSALQAHRIRGCCPQTKKRRQPLFIYSVSPAESFKSAALTVSSNWAMFLQPTIGMTSKSGLQMSDASAASPDDTP